MLVFRYDDFRVCFKVLVLIVKLLKRRIDSLLFKFRVGDSGYRSNVVVFRYSYYVDGLLSILVCRGQGFMLFGQGLVFFLGAPG